MRSVLNVNVASWCPSSVGRPCLLASRPVSFLPHQATFQLMHKKTKPVPSGGSALLSLHFRSQDFFSPNKKAVAWKPQTTLRRAESHINDRPVSRASAHQPSSVHALCGKVYGSSALFHSPQCRTPPPLFTSEVKSSVIFSFSFTDFSSH